MARPKSDNPFIAVMQESEGRTRRIPPPPVTFSSARPEATAYDVNPESGNMLTGAVRGLGNMIVGTGQSLAETVKRGMNLPLGPPGVGANRPGAAPIPLSPPQTTDPAAYAREVGGIAGSAVALPTPIGPIWPIPLMQGVGTLAGAGSPVESPSGEMVPPSAEQVGQRIGAGLGATALGAAPLGWRFVSRQPVYGRPALPAAGETAGAAAEGAGAPRPGYRPVFTDQGVVWVQDAPGAARAPSAPPSRPALPPAGPGMTGTKVPAGFTPVMATYRVRLSEAGAKGAPGDTAPFRDIEAVSPEDAVQRIKDEMGQEAAQYQFSAKPMKGTARPLTESQAAAEAAGTPRPTEQPRDMQARIAALAAAEGQGPTGARPQPQPKPIPLPGQVEAGAAQTSRQTTPPEEVTVRPSKGPAAPAVAPQAAVPPTATEAVRAAPLPGERGAAGPPPAESAPPAIVGVKSKVVREATPEEAAKLAPGTGEMVSPGEIAYRISSETERRLGERRGSGFGPTALAEEGQVPSEPPPVERRAPEAPGRRAEDLAKLNEALDEGNRRLKKIQAAKTHGELVSLYLYQFKHAPKPGIGTKMLREEMVREAQAIVQGAKQARTPKPNGETKPPPKGGAAAEAARAPEEGTTLYSGFDPGALQRGFDPIFKRAGEKARQVRDWLLVPESERTPPKPGETLRESMMRGELPKRGDRLRRRIAQAHSAWTQAMVLNYESRKFPAFHEQIDQFRVDAGRVQEKTTQLMADVIHPVVYRQDPTGAFKRRSDAEQFALARDLNWLLTVTDMWGRAREGKLTPANGFPDFQGLSQPQIAAILEGEAKAALTKAPGAVRQAHQNWIKLMQYAGEELKKRGELATPRDWTYGPNIFRGDTWADFRGSQRMARKAGEPARSYVKRALGHVRKHDTNMIRAGVDHVHSILMDNLSSDFAHSVGQAWDYSSRVWKQVEEIAKKRGVTPEQVMADSRAEDFYITGKDGERVQLVPYRVGMARHLWKPTSDIEFSMQKTLLEDPDFGLDFPNLAAIKEYAGKAKGAKAVYIIPEQVANSLRAFREPLNSFDRMGYAFGQGANVWKAATLMSVYTAYKTGNMIGDAANLVIRTPGTVPLVNGLKVLAGKTPKALLDIAKAYGPGGPSETVRRVDAVGGRQNVRATAEIGDLRAHKDLAVFYEPKAGPATGAMTAFGKAVIAGLDRFLIVDAVLEGAMRQASIEYLIEKGFPAKRAEQFTSHIIGDYRGVDRFTAMARRSWWFPFAVWMRQMVPGWTRWATGAGLGKHFEGPGGKAFSPPNLERPSTTPPPGTDPELWKMAQSGAYPKAGMKGLLVLAGLQMLLWYWNSVVNQELDEKVPDNIKLRHTYVINPMMKTSDGRPALLIDVVMPWDAVSGFFGTGNAPERIARLAKAAQSGKPEAVSQVVLSQIGETLTAPAQTVAGQAGPPLRVLGDVAELSRREYQERQKPVEKQRLDKVRASAARSILKDTVPFSRMMPGVAPLKRQDLVGLPGWTLYALKGTPFGFVTVPPSAEEKKRQYNRGAPADATRLRPGVGFGTSQLKSLSASQ